MGFFDYRDRFQQWISDQSAVFSFLMSHANSWERAIDEGNLEFDEEDEKMLLGAFRLWLSNCAKSTPKLKQLIAEAYEGETSVSGASDFFDQVQKAKDYVARIERIAASERSHGIRGIRLSEGEAQALERILPGVTPALR